MAWLRLAYSNPGMAQARLGACGLLQMLHLFAYFQGLDNTLLCSIQPRKISYQLSQHNKSEHHFQFLVRVLLSRFSEGDTGSTLRPTMTIKSVE